MQDWHELHNNLMFLPLLLCDLISIIALEAYANIEAQHSRRLSSQLQFRARVGAFTCNTGRFVSRSQSCHPTHVERWNFCCYDNWEENTQIFQNISDQINFFVQFQMKSEVTEEKNANFIVC